MVDWGTEEPKKKESNLASKILIALMILVIMIIIGIVFLLYYLKANTFSVTIDGKAVSDASNLYVKNQETTYFNISKLAGLLGDDYHIGEYKINSSDLDKCYIQSTEETASFYLNSNKICKLKVGQLTEEYDVFYSDKRTIKEDDVFFAPIDAAQIGFNIKIEESKSGIKITTLNTLVSQINTKFNKVKEGEQQPYASLENNTFDNKKALLYDYVILAKSNSNLYGVRDISGQEILSDKYTNITFIEKTKEFLVTNSLGKIGIIDKDGQNKVEQVYDSIKVISSNPKLYLVQVAQKYGVLDETGKTIIYPEYETIGVDSTKFEGLENQYVLVGNIIPVYKEKKYGLFDIKGNRILDVKYDGIGCDGKGAEVDGVYRSGSPVVEIPDCNGVVIKNGETYDLYYWDKKELITLRVSSIYSISSEGKKSYYMIYNGRELGLIEELVRVGKITVKDETDNTILPQNDVNTVNNTTTNDVVNNIEPVNAQ